MKILFFLVHPAHFHLFKYVISNLKKSGSEVFIIIRPKESLEALCIEAGLKYLKVSEGNRKNNKLSMLSDIIKRDYKAWKFIKKIKPDLMIGSSVEISHVGKILGIPSVITHEDDVDLMKYFAKAAFPYASAILSPDICRQGKWDEKTNKYKSYHELAYLHPNHYKPDPNIYEFLGSRNYFLLRFSQFQAHHDFGASGISNDLAKEVVNILKEYGDVFISSERPLTDELENYRLTVPVSKIHDVISYAKMVIGDSQSMTVEAAVLGVPVIRFNRFAEDFSISVIDELEKKYTLAVGINSSRPDVLISKIKLMISDKNLSSTWKERREILLNDKIDTCEFFLQFIKNYQKIIKINK